MPAVPDRLSPLDALLEGVAPALARGPCFVQFSGGRDSSTVLAAATRAARREGLPDPIPITLRFPEAPLAGESEWQEAIVSHLGLSDWRRVEVRDELDYVGPLAGPLLLRHGVLYPESAHAHALFAREAGTGTVLTGAGGDALFGEWRWQREALVLSRRRRPDVRGMPRLAYFVAPLSLRRAVAGRLGVRGRSWLTREGRAALRRAIALEADEPRDFRARVPWLACRRSGALARRSADLIARETGVAIENPLLDRRFMAAVAREGGWAGPGDRSAAMRRFFPGLLPDEVLGRRSKALFRKVFFERHTREFRQSWNRDSPLPDLVDTDALRRGMRNGSVPPLLIQAAWLAIRRGLG